MSLKQNKTKQTTPKHHGLKGLFLTWVKSREVQVVLLHHVTPATHDFQEILSRARDKRGPLVLIALPQHFTTPQIIWLELVLWPQPIPRGSLEM